MVKRYSISQGVCIDPYPDVFVMASDYDALEAELAGCKQQLAVAPSYAKMIAHHGRQEQRIATLETVLRGLLDAFETDQSDDFTAYDEPIPSAVHAARAALECSPSRPDNLSSGSAPSDAAEQALATDSATNRTAEHE